MLKSNNRSLQSSPKPLCIPASLCTEGSKDLQVTRQQIYFQHDDHRRVLQCFFISSIPNLQRIAQALSSSSLIFHLSNYCKSWRHDLPLLIVQRGFWHCKTQLGFPRSCFAVYSLSTRKYTVHFWRREEMGDPNQTLKIRFHFCSNSCHFTASVKHLHYINMKWLHAHSFNLYCQQG